VNRRPLDGLSRLSRHDPNYADAKDGLLLDGVRDESPASKAGLKAGDKIVKLAGR